MWLDELRRKPKAVRDQYAFFGAFIITAVIGGFWLIGLGVSMYDTTNATSTATVAPTSAFGTFIEGIKEQFDKAVEPLQELQEVAETATTSTEVASSSANMATSSTPAFTFSTSTPATSTAGREGRPILIATTSSSVQ